MFVYHLTHAEIDNYQELSDSLVVFLLLFLLCTIGLQYYMSFYVPESRKESKEQNLPEICLKPMRS